MMEKGKKMMTDGEHMTDGTLKQRKSSVCKVCGKEGLPKHIKIHIESNSLDGITLSLLPVYSILSSLCGGAHI